MIKNPPVTQETEVQSMDWEDFLEEDGNPLQYSCLENSVDRDLGGYSPQVAKSQRDTTEAAERAHA